MSYADPAKIKTHELKLHLDDEERDLLMAIVKYNGGQKGVIARNLLMEHVRYLIESTPESIADIKFLRS